MWSVHGWNFTYLGHIIIWKQLTKGLLYFRSCRFLHSSPLLYRRTPQTIQMIITTRYSRQLDNNPYHHVSVKHMHLLKNFLSAHSFKTWYSMQFFSVLMIANKFKNRVHGFITIVVIFILTVHYSYFNILNMFRNEGIPKSNLYFLGNFSVDFSRFPLI